MSGYIERVRRLRVEVPSLARIIEISSVEDHKGRGWSKPVARLEGPGGCDDYRIARSEVAAMNEALTRAFNEYEREFGPDKP